MGCARVTHWDDKSRHIHAAWLPDAVDILLDARAHEGPATLELGVRVRPERRGFQGDSFGLALAVADKFARFGRAETGQEIIATGALEPSGCGRLSAVSGFDGKTQGVLDYIAAHKLRNAIYLFAAGNLPDLKEETRVLLEAMCEETGLECLPMYHLSDAAHLWSAAPPAPVVRKARARNAWRPTAPFKVLAALLVMAFVLGAGVWFFWPRPSTAPMSADDCIDNTGAPLIGPAAVRNAQGQGDFGLDVRLNAKHPSYAIGEAVIVRASVDRAAYLRILELDRNGRTALVYPNRYQKDALVAPGDSLAVALRASAPAGPTLLKVIAMAAQSGEGMEPGAPPYPNPEYLLTAGRWQEAATCLRITP